MATYFARLAFDQCTKYTNWDGDVSTCLGKELKELENIIQILQTRKRGVDDRDRLLEEAYETQDMILDDPVIDPMDCFGFCWCLAGYGESFLVGRYVSDVKKRVRKRVNKLKKGVRRKVRVGILTALQPMSREAADEYQGNYLRLEAEPEADEFEESCERSISGQEADEFEAIQLSTAAQEAGEFEAIQLPTAAQEADEFVVRDATVMAEHEFEGRYATVMEVPEADEFKGIPILMAAQEADEFEGNYARLMGEQAHKVVKRIVKKVRNGKSGIIGIYGACGVGKTHVVRYACRIPQIRSDSITLIWLELSNEDDILKLQMKIANKIGLQLPNNGIVQDNANMLKSALEKKDNVLFVFDNMTKAFSLEEIGLSVNGISIIITSRSFAVCCEMQCDEKIALRSLSNDEAYELLKDEIGNSTFLSSEKIQFTLKNIAKECGGLPLAIIAAAKLLSRYFYYDHVFNTERSLEKEFAAFSNLKYIEKKIIKDLELSYEQLEHSSYGRAKECLLHYIMYPRNHAFAAMELMNYWMAAGLLREGEGIDETLEDAKGILGELKDASLLESVAFDNGEETVKMHPIVWDMAVKLEKKNPRFFTKPGCRIEKFKWEDLSKDVEKVSLMNNKLKELPPRSSAFKFDKLSTLLLQGNPLDIQLDRDFFNNFPNLKILDLSDTSVRLEPGSLSCLKYLTVLLLGNCTHLTCLPSQGRSMQDDSATWMEDVQKLEYLIVLEVNFPSLQLYNSYIANSLHWRQLRSYKFCVGGIYRGNLKNNGLAFLNEFPHHENCLPDNTSELLLIDCGNVTQLTIPKLSNMKFLDVSYCMGLKHLFTDFVANNLRNLEEIVIAHCGNLVKLIEKDSSTDVLRITWCRLRKLTLLNLPQLQFVSDDGIYTASLEEIGIWNCPRLQKFPISMRLEDNQNLKDPQSLNRIRGDDSWLENLKRNSDLYVHFLENTLIKEPPPEKLTSRIEMVVPTPDIASGS
ncbi:Disease resistance protein [Melia azedarach]|nr:Disease resistance protein [Melia azedarach]